MQLIQALASSKHTIFLNPTQTGGRTPWMGDQTIMKALMSQENKE
jgi:hypothetical protein